MTAYVLIVLPSLGQSLLENYAYRQTQTAYTAVLFARDGVDLLHPPLPVLGVPGIVPLEFPLFQAVASMVIDAGMRPDMASRITGLGCFLASALLLYLVATRVLNRLASLVVLAAFLLNAHSLLYGRSALIEYLANAGGLGFVFFATRWIDRGRPLHWTLAAVFGTVVVLVKVTTGPIYLLLPLLWRDPGRRVGYRKPGTWLLVAACVGIGIAWSSYADVVRLSNPGTEFLAARNQAEWFFGSLPQRLDPLQWRTPLAVWLALTGSAFVVWGWLAWRLARHHCQRPFLMGVLIVAVIPVLVLFNLYARHEYYYAAVAPLVALVIGMGVQELIAIKSIRLRRLTAVGLAGAWLMTLVGLSGSWTVIYGSPRDEARVMKTVNFIRTNSSEDDWVVVEGFGWNSTFLYYAGRRGYAVPTGDNLVDPGEVDVEAIISDPVYGPFFDCDPDGTCTVSETRRPTGTESPP